MVTKKNVTTDMTRRRSVAQGAKILSTGVATSGMFALTAVFGAAAREADTSQTVTQAQPQAQVPAVVQDLTQQPSSTTQGQRVTDAPISSPVQEQTAVAAPVTTGASAEASLAAPATSTTAVFIVAPQPIVVVVPDTRPLQAPPTTASR